MSHYLHLKSYDSSFYTFWVIAEMKLLHDCCTAVFIVFFVIETTILSNLKYHSGIVLHNTCKLL